MSCLNPFEIRAELPPFHVVLAFDDLRLNPFEIRAELPLEEPGRNRLVATSQSL